VVWLAVTAMPVFAVLKYGLGDLATGLVVAARGGAYLLAVYLYYIVARAVRSGSQVILWGAFLTSLAISMAVVDRRFLWSAMLEWGMIFPAAYIVGKLGDTKAEQSRRYIAGLVPVFLFGLGWLLVMWHDMYVAIRYVTHSDVVSNLTEIRLPVSWTGTVNRIAGFIARLWPGLMIMAAVTQYSVGFLWLSMVEARTERHESPLRRFPFWQLPRPVVVFLTAALIAAVVGHGTVQLAGLNAVFALSVFYCIFGLAVVEYHLMRLGVHIAIKTIVYVLMIPTGIFGYAALCLLGLINSIYDWRKVAVD
jgi:hypothetical protein